MLKYFILRHIGGEFTRLNAFLLGCTPFFIYPYFYHIVYMRHSMTFRSRSDGDVSDLPLNFYVNFWSKYTLNFFFRLFEPFASEIGIFFIFSKRVTVVLKKVKHWKMASKKPYSPSELEVKKCKISSKAVLLGSKWKTEKYP